MLFLCSHAIITALPASVSSCPLPMLFWHSHPYILYHINENVLVLYLNGHLPNLALNL